MSDESKVQDSFEFLKSMWGNMGFSLPGMMTPTTNVDEIAQRIADLKAVEGWLKMNLNMLQMTIQGMEVQRAALMAMQAFTQPASSGQEENMTNTFVNSTFNPALWPWNFMQPSQPPASTTEAPQPDKPSDAPHRKKK